MREDWDEIALRAQFRITKADEQYAVIWSSANLQQQEFFGKDSLAYLNLKSEAEYFEYGHESDMSDIDETKRLINISNESSGMSFESSVFSDKESNVTIDVDYETQEV